MNYVSDIYIFYFFLKNTMHSSLAVMSFYPGECLQ